MQRYDLPNRQLVRHSASGQQITLDLSQPQIMGILNVTPDSFSDGGTFNKMDAALRHCEQMLFEGASIIDIGGESTRPNATIVTAQEECDRVIPIVASIRQRFGDIPWLSIDTSAPMVIEAAVKAGANIWNDVRALKREGAVEMAAKLNIPVVIMHMRGEPTTMGSMAQYTDVVEDVIAELKERIELVIAAGVKSSHIILDPGFGFAKNHAHHKTLLTQLHRFLDLNFPILFGISRKRFLGEVLEKSNIAAFRENKPLDRDGAGMAAALLAVQQGASIIRTHNVGLTAQGLSLWQQLQS